MNLKEAQEFTIGLEVELERMANMYSGYKDDNEFEKKLRDTLDKFEELNLLLIKLENSIPRKKIEDKIKSLDSNNKDERMIKFYTLDKKYYYQTDKYNKIIKQILQELLEEK